MNKKIASQELWIEGEAAERAGKMVDAVKLYAQAAMHEEKPLRARYLWEQLSQKTGGSASIFERLATVCTSAKQYDDAFSFWIVCAAKHAESKKTTDADRAFAHAKSFAKKLSTPAKEWSAEHVPESAKMTWLSEEEKITTWLATISS